VGEAVGAPRGRIGRALVMRRYNCCALSTDLPTQGEKRGLNCPEGLCLTSKNGEVMGIANSAGIPRIDFVSPVAPSSPSFDAFREGPNDLGYVEGRIVVSESRFAEEQ
jgi:hypothetical protein